MLILERKISVLRILKTIGIVIGSIILGFSFLVLLSLCIVEKTAIYIIPMIICAIPIFFLCLSLKRNKDKKQWIQIETPKEQQKELKNRVTKNQIQDSIRIMNDCMSLMKTTKNLDVFFERWELGKQQNLFLKQCEDCKLYKKKPTSNDYAKFFFNNDVLLKLIISKSYIDTIEKAEKLKTESGKAKRISNYFQKLDEYSHLFSPEIEEYVVQLRKGR